MAITKLLFKLPLFLKLNCFQKVVQIQTIYDVEIKPHFSRDERS